MTAFDIEKALRDGRNTKAYMSMIPGLTKADLDAVTVDSVQKELNRVRRYVRSHADNRGAVKHLAALGPEFFPKGLKIEDLDDGVFRALICTNFQAVMLREFGDFCLLDSVHSVIRNGMNQLTVMVIDEFGRGIPVGFALVTSEDASSWKSLLEYCFERAERKAGDIGVQRHLLCAFQMLQAIDRRFKSNLLSISAYSIDLGSTLTSPLRARSSASDSVSSNPVKWLRRSSPRRDTVSPICTQLSIS